MKSWNNQSSDNNNKVVWKIDFEISYDKVN
jgi:hypothetical protein